MKGEKGCLLGRPEIVKLGILQRPEVSAVSRRPEELFSKIFEGMGCLKEPYKIELRPDAAPYAISCPRRIAIPLLEKTKAKLETMAAGAQPLIRRIEKPAEWCAPVVVIPKADEDIRLCVDYSKLNAFVIRPRLQLPAVYESLAKIPLTENVVFSIRDAKQGYWKVPLHPESQELTTFLTPFGRYCWNRLPMGLSSAGEYYQSQMQAIIGEIPGVTIYQDDIVIHGQNNSQHDERLMLVLERLLNAGIRLNRKKCHI